MPQPAHPFESKNWDGGPCKGSINAVETCIVSSISALTRRSRKGVRRDSGNKPRPFLLATMSEGMFSLLASNNVIAQTFKRSWALHT